MIELSKFTQLISDKLDAANLIMEKLETQVDSLKKVTLELRAKNAELVNELSIIREKIRSLEQYSCRNNIEISGL